MDISKFLVKLFGDKKSRDLKAYRPLVEMVTKAYPAVQALSHDELRARTAAIKKQIADSALDLKKEIQELKDKVKVTDIQDRAPLFAQIDKLEKEVLELYLEGNDYTEIAKMLGKTDKSIDNALQRIKAKIQKNMK